MKTIEEASVEYAAKLNYSMEAKHNMCPRDFEIAFKDGATHIMSLPLADRLTAEEREKIKGIYADAHPEDPGRSFASLCVTRTLEDIFGKEMFAEEGGDK